MKPLSGTLNLLELLNAPELRLCLENMDEKRLSKIEVCDNRIQLVGLSIAGFVDDLYKSRIQLFGKSEMDYLKHLKPKERSEMSCTFLKEKPVLVIFTSSTKPPDDFKEIALKYSVPLMSTTMVTSIFIDYIRNFLLKKLSLYITMHAQLVDVFGVGMLITGESGVGKSEASLDLVMRGHKLVADDIVEIRHSPPDKLIGTCSEMAKNLIEIRGVGIVDLQQMFGITSVIFEKEIDCIVRLAFWDESNNFDYDRVGSQINYHEILGTKKPHYLIPIRNGSNLSSIMEVVARDYLLKKAGVNVAKQFEEKLFNKLKKNGGD
ncbi:MAG: HPr(Ser) kinase/phosphatase [bacterium]